MAHKRIIWWSMLVVCTTCGVDARVGVINLGPSYYEVTTEVETPHIKWAKPLAGGPLRALVIAPRRTQRETVELWQRIEMEYVAIGTEETGVLGATPDPNGPVGGTLPEVEARLREAMKQDYDVIITSGVHWKTLPPDVLNSLVGKVKAGAGLVLVQPEEKPEGAVKEFYDSFQETPRPPWVLAGSRLEDLPHYRKGEKDQIGPPEKVFSCYRVGDRRVARVRTGGSYWTYLVPDVGDTLWATYLDFEDQMAFAAKLLLWAAGREPAATVAAVSYSPDTKSAHVELMGAPNASGKGACRMTIRDQWGNVLATPTRACDLVSGASAFDVPLPPLKGGQHRAEVQLLNGQGAVMWWGVWPLGVVPPFGISKVTLPSDEVQPGAPAKGTVELTGKPVPGAKLVFKVTDAYGRVVCVVGVESFRRLTPGRDSGPTATVPFSVLDPHPLSVYHELSVTLIAGGRVLDEKRTRFATPIKGPGWDDFSFLFWHHSTEGWIGRLVNRELSRKYLGDSLNCAAWQTPQRMEDILWRLAEDGLWATPYTTHFGNYWGSGLNRGPCLSHPDLIREKTTHTREVGRRLKKFRPPAYNLGDENTLDGKDTDVCFSNECQASFREYLKAMYKDLDTLNAEWGTTFKDWSEVSPITKKEALEKAQVPRWVDHRMHMNSVFANIHRLCRDATRESDPQARVGFEGPVGQAGYNGYDLWKFSKFMDFWGPYPYAVDWYDAPRSFCPKGYYSGVWYGGYPDIRYDFHHRSWPWRAVTSGLCAAWWFDAYDGSCCSALAPDFRPYPDFVEGLKEIRRLKSGVGKLLMHAGADYDPVAIHYSMESLYAALAYDTPAGASSGYYPFSQVLGESGLSYSLIAPEQIERGDLKRFRALLLPASQALSDREAAAIRQFGESGGVVIADVRPGVTDEHGKIRRVGALDSLFGVKQDLSLVGEQPESHEVSVAEGPLGKLDKLTLCPGISLDPEAKDATATAAGDASYFIVRKVGKGKAILLNFAAKQGIGLGKALSSYLNEVGVKPRITVEDDTGNRIGTPLPYRDGNAYTLVLSAQTSSPQRVKLPASAYCYLADEGKYLGFTDKPVVDVNRSLWMRVLVCLPYSVDKLPVTHRPGDHPREHKFRFAVSTKGGKAGFHVFHVTVTGPDGSKRACYAANVSCPNGAAEYVLPLAVNDPTGRWTVTAMDVATGVQAKGEFQG